MASQKVTHLISPAQAPGRHSPIRSYNKANRELAGKFDSWLTSMNYSPNTLRAYKELTRDFCEFIRSKSLTNVRQSDVREFLAHLSERGLAPSSLARQLHGLRTFFDFLNLAGVVSFVAPRFIRTRKVPKRLPRFLTEEQVRKLIEAARGTRDRALLELFYATGCRLSEVVGMKAEDVDFEHRSIRVVGKGSKERIVLFGRPAKEALLAYLGDRRTGYLLEDDSPAHKVRRPKGSGPLAHRTVYRIVAGTALRAGLSKVSPKETKLKQKHVQGAIARVCWPSQEQIQA